MSVTEHQEEDASRQARPRRWPALLGIVLLVLAVPVGGLAWLFQDELFHPFGDVRACEGSERALPAVIIAGGTPLPADASDVHYVTRGGQAQVSFLSDRMPEYLVGADLHPEGTPFFDKRNGGQYGLGDGEPELPQGLCGSPLRGPLWSYGKESVGVLVERSPLVPDAFPSPARAVITYPLP
ncbi:hypothetical protein [Streptomyces sp. NPDC054975]